MKTQTYELHDGNTMEGACKCGRCSTSLKDERGNVDYGYRWSEPRGTYVARICPIAAARRQYADR